MTLVELDPSFRNIFFPDAKLTKIASGFVFTEGPVWHPLEECLYFSDIPGSVRSKWDGRKTTTVINPSNKGNGMTLDANLDLLVCEHVTSSVVRFSKDGRRHVLASHFGDKELNSPNDICVKSDGSIYFSDPSYGRTAMFGKERPTELGFQGIYRLKGGKVELLVPKETFTQPNGLCFSPDERLLYVNDTVQANIRVFDVRPDGLIENPRIFATGIVGNPDEGVADGMKCDELGNIWCTAPDGLWVYNVQGKMIGKVLMPEVAGNLHWGGTDWKTLFICGSTSVYSIEVKVGPHREPFMRAADTHKSATRLAPPARVHDGRLQLDVSRTALIIQDMQNDVVSEGGAFSGSGSPQHCREQKAIAHIAEIAARCRAMGIPVIHVWFSCPPGYAGIGQNAHCFKVLVQSGGCVDGTGAQSRRLSFRQCPAIMLSKRCA